MPDTRTRIKSVADRFGLLPLIRRPLNIARRMKSAVVSRRVTKEVIRHQGPLSSFVFETQVTPPAQKSKWPADPGMLEADNNPNGNRLNPSLPFQVDYASHPGFTRHLAWNKQYDDEVDALVDTLNQDLLDLEDALTLKRTTLSQAINQIRVKVHSLIAVLRKANDHASADFAPFAKRFEFEILRIAIDDLAYFERRNSYVPVINNAEELTLRNELGVKGFIEFDLSQDELDFLQRNLQAPTQLLEERYCQGGRSRDDLATIDVNAESKAMIYEVFERRGLNKAVSDVRHESIKVGGFCLELSTDDTDWWHSRYEDVGLTSPNASSYFHNDEGRDIYKAIVYLDDVGEDSGTFCYVPSSYNMERPRFEWIVSRATLTTLQAPEIMKTMDDILPSRGVFSSQVSRKFFGMLPPRLRLNSHFGFDVLDDTEIARKLESNQRRMVGPAGHVILFDGSRIVHRGGLVRRGRRRALQVCFDILDRRNALELSAELRREFGY